MMEDSQNITSIKDKNLSSSILSSIADQFLISSSTPNKLLRQSIEKIDSEFKLQNMSFSGDKFMKTSEQNNFPSSQTVALFRQSKREKENDGKGEAQKIRELNIKKGKPQNEEKSFFPRKHMIKKYKSQEEDQIKENPNKKEKEKFQNQYWNKEGKNIEKQKIQKLEKQNQKPFKRKSKISLSKRSVGNEINHQERQRITKIYKNQFQSRNKKIFSTKICTEPLAQQRGEEVCTGQEKFKSRSSYGLIENKKFKASRRENEESNKRISLRKSCNSEVKQEVLPGIYLSERELMQIVSKYINRPTSNNDQFSLEKLIKQREKLKLQIKQLSEELKILKKEKKAIVHIDNDEKVTKKLLEQYIKKDEYNQLSMNRQKKEIEELKMKLNLFGEDKGRRNSLHKKTVSARNFELPDLQRSRGWENQKLSQYRQDKEMNKEDITLNDLIRIPLDIKIFTDKMIENLFDFEKNEEYQNYLEQISEERKILSVENDIIEKKVTKVYENGRRQIEYNKGMQKEIFPNGYEITFLKNGDVKQVNNPQLQKLSNGIIIYYFSKKKINLITLPSGIKIYRLSNNQLEFHLEDRMEIRYPNGSYQII